MAFSYQVILSDPFNAGGSNDAVLVYDLEQALSVWSQYVNGSGTLRVTLEVDNTSAGRMAGGPTSVTSAGTNGGLTVYEAAAQYELRTGTHISSDSDITVSVDPGYFQYLDLSAGLTYSSTVTPNRYNPIVVMLHEVMHGFGMTGWYDSNGNLPGNYESTFDTFISLGPSATFLGQYARFVYGAPVPLTTSVSEEAYYHFGNTVSDFNRSPGTVIDPLTVDLMNGIVFFFNYQYPINPLDLGVLMDMGYDLTDTALALLLTVSSGVTRHVDSGSNLSGIVVLGGGTVGVLAGGSASGTVISSAGIEQVYGVASGTVVNGLNSWQYVFAGGIAAGTSAASQGIQLVFSGGIATGTRVSASSFLLNYGSAAGTIVSAGGQAYVESGGAGSGAQVLAGGIEQVLAGGTASGTVVSNGAFQFDQGLTVGTQILFGAQQYVSSGGLASGTVVSSGGVQQVFGGGLASGTSVKSGAYQLDFGSAVSTTLDPGGYQYVFSGAFASVTSVGAGDVQFIAAGGTARANALASGAYQINFGTVSGTSLGPAANQYVYNLASAISTTVSAGAIQNIQAGGLANGTVVSGGYQFVFGLAEGTTLSSGANQFVFNGGVASNTAVSSGGLQYLLAGGTAIGATVESGGLRYDYGSAIATTFSGGVAYVFSGASESATVLLNGAAQVVFSGGIVSGGTISSGGTQYDSGIARGETVRGGVQNVYGVASSTLVSTGYQVVMAGATASNTILSAGGNQFVYGAASATVVSAGGYQLVLAGGSAIGVTLSGGELEIASGGTVGAAPVSFSSAGGYLKLDDSQHFTGTIAGMSNASQMLDLVDIAFGSSTVVTWSQTAVGSGTLTVSDGVHVANLTLLGQYTTTQFTKANDGAGGTLITDPPVSSAAGFASPH